MGNFFLIQSQSIQFQIDEHISKAYEFKKLNKKKQSMDEFESAIQLMLDEAESYPEGNEKKIEIASTIGGVIENYTLMALADFRIDKTFAIGDRARKLTNDRRLYSTLLMAPVSLKAHTALGDGNFEEAIRLFSILEEIALKDKNGGREMYDFHPSFYKKISINAMEMKNLNITPEYTLKIFSPRYTEVLYQWKDGSATVSWPLLKLKNGDLLLANIAENSLRQSILVMSEGKLDLAFERETIPSVQIMRPLGLTNVFKNNGSEIVEELDGQVGEMIRNRLKENDVLFLFYGGIDSTAFHGGSFNLEISGKKIKRGIINISKQTFRYDSDSGFSPSLMGAMPRLYLHEFFHIVESKLGIRPSHGFKTENRKHFPNWKGNDQLEYYWWHFRETIPSRLKEANRKGNWLEISYL